MRYSVPGKVFLLGEYAVLGGFPAVVATVAPRFELAVGGGDAPSYSNAFAMESPAGKLIAAHGERLLGQALQFSDPYQGHGGFGASSAQFGLLARVIADLEKRDFSIEETWATYKDLTLDSVLPPSGADLVAQLSGGVSVIEVGDQVKVQNLQSSMDWSKILIFSAAHQPARKTRTHDHLNEISKRGFLTAQGLAWMSGLEGIIKEGIEAILKGDAVLFARSLLNYAQALADVELEAPEARDDRLAFSELPQIIGVKGAGALQSDALVVVIDPSAGASEIDHVISWAAQKRDLRLISRGLSVQPGIS